MSNPMQCPILIPDVRRAPPHIQPADDKARFHRRMVVVIPFEFSAPSKKLFAALRVNSALSTIGV